MRCCCLLLTLAFVASEQRKLSHTRMTDDWTTDKVEAALAVSGAVAYTPLRDLHEVDPDTSDLVAAAAAAEAAGEGPYSARANRRLLRLGAGRGALRG